MRIVAVVGTRPEAIKVAPVVREARARGIETLVCATAQHREMLDQVLDLFELEADIDLDLMQPGQTLAALSARALTALDEVIDRVRPDWLLVQGDTTTAMIAAMVGFYRRVQVGHIEAGLRTGDLERPFPEEFNRRVADTISAAHFVPTPSARDNLLGEGFSPDTLHLTGNTVVDALQWMLSRDGDALSELAAVLPPPDARMVLVTAHRRESFGDGMREIAAALRQVAQANPDVHFVYPVHPNPEVREVMEAELADRDRIALLPPLPYQSFVQLMARAELILSDSGGVQEEAPSLGVPALVMRETTERPEAVEAGAVRLVGVRADTIVPAANELLSDPDLHARMARAINPYGDGLAAQRIVAILAGTPWEPFGC